MEGNYDLCSGRDRRGRIFCTRLPAGVARTGMYIRLIGGVFMLVERVENCGRAPGNVPVCVAAQVLEGIWEGGHRGGSLA